LGYEHSPTWFKNNNNLNLINKVNSQALLGQASLANGIIPSKLLDNFIKDKNIKPEYIFENLDSPEKKYGKKLNKLVVFI
jgi:CRISPR/Cas system CMR-associated protein Cmr3 (group 5 of RAMP superfamily)